MMKTFRLCLPTLMLTVSFPAFAGCPAGYAQQERASIKRYYDQQIAETNTRRDQQIRDALTRYQNEYYPESKARLEELQKDRAALSERIRSEGVKKGGQAEINAEAREISRDYHKDISTLRKDHTGKYWKEIMDIREEARESRQAIAEMKADDIASLRKELAENCKSQKTPLRRASEWISNQIHKGEKPDSPPDPIGWIGIRG